MILLVVFISGCDGVNQSYEQYRKGTQGIVLSFVEGAPPARVFDTDKFMIGVNVKNMGAETASNIDFGISGYDTEIIGMSSAKPDVRNLRGKAELFNSQEGESNLIVFEQTSTKLMDADTYTPTFMVTACYNYKTIAQAQVCLNGNPSFNKGVCTVSDVSLSGGQGGPVGVTNIEVAATPGKTNFKIHIKNFGSGGPCTSGQPDKLEYVTVDSVQVHNEPLKDCKPFDDDNKKRLRLIEGEGVLYCDMNVGSNDVYTTPIIITLSYGYSTTITKSLEIIKAPR